MNSDTYQFATPVKHFGISRRLLVYVIISSIAFALIATSISIYFEHRRNDKSILRSLDFIENFYVIPIASSLYKMDEDQLTLEMQSALKIADIVYLQLNDKAMGGNYSLSVGNLQGDHTITREFPLAVQDNTGTVSVGTLKVTATMDNVHTRLKGMALKILLIITAVIFCLSLTIYFIMKSLVTRHLLTMSDFAMNLNLDTIGNRLSLVRRPLPPGHADELEEVVQSINLMLKRIDDGLSVRKESEKLFRTLFEQAAVGVAQIITETGQFVHINSKYCDIVGYSKEEMKQLTFREITYPDDLQSYLNNMQKLIQGDLSEFSMEKRYYHKNGSIVQVSLAVSPMWQAGETPYYSIAVIEDITARKQIEKELQKIKNLEAIGTLAGGIAHDFNNLLAGIIANIYLSKSRLEKDGSAYKYLEAAEKAIERASNLTQQLLTFSAGGAPIKKSASITEIVRESAEFVLSGSKVTSVYHAGDDLRPVEVDAGQISQAIQNLILNASQAMPSGGTIQVFIDNIELDQDAGLPLEAGRYVMISIKDMGTGIPEEHMQTLFDPYFSTKEMGRGLGLSITYSIIKNHGGYISVASEIGAGATFTIYLPASGKQTEEKVSTEALIPKGQGKILLMDDEEIIRKSVGSLLEMSGYEVECAENGDKAVALYQKAMDTAAPFDAVILDLTVRGGMGGEEAIMLLLDIDPGVKAIVSSGYSNNPVMANFRDYGFSDALVKPLKSPEELNRILRNVLK